jgi:hypothetical protein
MRRPAACAHEHNESALHAPFVQLYFDRHESLATKAFAGAFAALRRARLFTGKRAAFYGVERTCEARRRPLAVFREDSGDRYMVRSGPDPSDGFAQMAWSVSVLHRIAALVALAAFACSAASQAAGPPPSVQIEIDHLFGYLADSGCRFNRNGTWYPAREARDHLKKKLDYLVRKGLLSTTESFIERAASKSSASGEPYLVECPGATALQSGPWFTSELLRFRRDGK